MSRPIERRSVSTTRPIPRVLHLHRHIATVVRERTVHLRQRGRGDGLAREAREGLLRRGAQLAAHLRDHLVVGARGHGILQTAEHGPPVLEGPHRRDC